MNRDGSLPPGVKLVPYYDRSSLIRVTTHTVLHNLIFGCLLVFLVQWVFLGDLRSAILVGVNIPFALLFSRHPAGVARRERESALGRRGRFRHHRRLRRHPRRECLPSLPEPARADIQRLLQRPVPRRLWITIRRLATPRPGPDNGPIGYASADQRNAGRPRDLFLDAHHRRRVRPAVHDAGGRGADLSGPWRAPMGTRWPAR